MYVCGPSGLNRALNRTRPEPSKVNSAVPSGCTISFDGPDTLTTIDFPVSTFVTCSFRTPSTSTRTSPFASGGYVLMDWLFSTGVPASRKAHTRPARNWKDCWSSVTATIVGLPSAADSAVGLTSTASAETLVANSKKSLSLVILVSSSGVAARHDRRVRAPALADRRKQRCDVRANRSTRLADRLKAL